MPLLFARRFLPHSSFAAWHIAEPLSAFVTNTPLSAEEAIDVKTLKGQRHTEWWACRWLLHFLTGAHQRMPLAKTAFSKPFFLNHPDLFCSLSHSHGIVGAMLSEVNCGCDLQVEVPKMARIAPRFLRADEQDWIVRHPSALHTDLQHLFWTMKEALYKTYSLRALDFREHLYIASFAWDGREGHTTATIRKDHWEGHYQLTFGKYSAPDPDFDHLSAPTTLPLPTLYWTICIEAGKVF